MKKANRKHAGHGDYGCKRNMHERKRFDHALAERVNQSVQCANERGDLERVQCIADDDGRRGGEETVGDKVAVA